jgi:hypothetical protein
VGNDAMYVFYALFFLCLLLVWLFLSRYFARIGRVIDKIIKPFNDKPNDKDKKNEVGGTRNE